jgi:SpoVK/Ycf46/Vps4 family AAA+-type ATPase
MKITNSEQAADKVNALIRAKTPFVYVISDDERRVSRCIVEKSGKGKEVLAWSSHTGLVRLSNGEKLGDNTESVSEAFNYIHEMKVADNCKSAIVIMYDAHVHINPHSARQMRDIYYALFMGKDKDRLENPNKYDQSTWLGPSKTVIFISGKLAHVSNGIMNGVEDSLKTQMEVVDWPLPTRSELGTYIKGMVDTAAQDKKDTSGDKKLDYNSEEIQEFARALQGLSEIEVSRAMSECLVTHGKLVLDDLLDRKREIIKRDDILEVIDYPPSMDDVGGLDEVKKFADMYSCQFSEGAEKFGVEPLRGMILTGIPGTGKSLLAKAFADRWKIPCFRLEVGKVMAGIVGSSEERIRRVIKTIEAASPSILWIDEIEKEMAGTRSSDRSDAGTLARVFSTLLNAMEERMENVIIIATANNIEMLPPELIRRFDEVFFADLPVKEEREEIFTIHVSKRKKDLKKIDTAVLAEKTDGYTGSEIEKTVKQGIAIAWQNKDKEVTTEHIAGAIEGTRPISEVMKTDITRLRKWAKERARVASSKSNLSTKKRKKKHITLDSLESPSLSNVIKDSGGEAN